MAEWKEALTEEKAEPQAEPESEEAKAEEPTEGEAEAEPEKDETPDEPEKKDHQVPLSAMLAERDKAKSLKDKVNALEAQVQSLAEPKEEPIEFDEDPKAYLDKTTSELRKEFEDRLILSSRAITKREFSDYEEKETIFIEAARKDPSLEQRMRKAENPALFAYETAKSIELQEKYGDNPTEWAKQIEADVRKKLEAELTSKTKANAKASAKQPTNLNDLRAAGGEDEPEYTQVSWGDALK